MKVGFVQPTAQTDAQASLANALQGIETCVQQGAQLILLPEMWQTPYTLKAMEESACHSRQLLQALQDAAARHKVWIMSGTFSWREEGNYWNRAFVIDDTGAIAAQADKCHLLEVRSGRRSFNEANLFTPGRSLCTLDTPWGKAGLLICYDIRFPEAARLISEDILFLMVPAAFNAAVGKKHWKPLLQTRAMENEIFVFGINPAAHTYEGYQSYGHSLAADPDGTVLLEMDGMQLTAVVDIDLNRQTKIRHRSPFWEKRRTDLYDLQHGKSVED